MRDDTDRSVRSFLARAGGKKGDLSRFVDRAVRQAIFWETLEFGLATKQGPYSVRGPGPRRRGSQASPCESFMTPMSLSAP
ncbi:MAG: hypothetical protein OXI11_09985 [Gammaproteobacteria bacterium]|nr:hypothetical protein [Gammaproteobacteria bacterium]